MQFALTIGHAFTVRADAEPREQAESATVCPHYFILRPDPESPEPESWLHPDWPYELSGRYCVEFRDLDRAEWFFRHYLLME